MNLRLAIVNDTNSGENVMLLNDMPEECQLLLHSKSNIKPNCKANVQVNLIGFIDHSNDYFKVKFKIAVRF